MENTDIIRLVNKFDESSAYTREMNEALEKFTHVLTEFNTSAKRISEIQTVFEKSGFFTDLTEKAQQISLVFQTVINDISILKNDTSETGHKLSEITGEYKKDIEKLVESIEPLGYFENTLREIAQISQKIDEFISSKFENNLSTFNVSIKDLSGKIVETEKLFADNLNLIDNTITKLNEKIETSEKTFSESSKNTNDRIDKLIERNDALIQLVQVLAENSNTSLEKFVNFADEWAENSVHGVALKKKKR